MTVARFGQLSTAHLIDACIRAGVPVRAAGHPMRASVNGARLFGRVLPARHVGSVDVFLEAINSSAPGDVLVADNGGRLDEACIGDLLALEAKGAELAGIVIWGLHRDSAEIAQIGLPLFSLGSIPNGPLAVTERPGDASEIAHVGNWSVTRDDLIAADDDGVVALPADRAEELLTVAESIRDTERAQAERIVAGKTLRTQVDFDGYLLARAVKPDLTFRDHLRSVEGEIEV